MTIKNIIITSVFIFFHIVRTEEFPNNTEQVKNNELPVVVLICSYNNEKWVQKNLDSVFSQQYKNFRVIYIDDCSTDNTVNEVQSYIDTHNLQDQITLQANKVRCRKMKNLYNAIHACDDFEIIIQLDGDDWFTDITFFNSINELYSTNNVWLTYGSYEIYPSGERGYAQPVPEEVVQKHGYRKHKWVFMHPRTFYVWLFKLIKLKDLITHSVPNYEGYFFPASNDVVTMIPMIEMADSRIHYLDKITYSLNRNNPLSGINVDSILQGAVGEKIERDSTILYSIVLLLINLIHLILLK